MNGKHVSLTGVVSLKKIILLVFLSLNSLAWSIDGRPKRDDLYIYINYQNQKIDNYFLVVGFENNKIKFSEFDPKAILGLENYLNLKKYESGTILLKTSETCLEKKSENEVQYSIDSEYVVCRRSSVIENLGKTSFVFWIKKLYFTCRDFVDWL